MTTPRFFLPAGWLAIFFALIFSSWAAPLANAADLKVEVQLIWGANDEKSPEPTHKPVADDISKLLKAGPYKWKNYFEVNRQGAALQGALPKKLQMSPKCTLELTSLGDGRLEIRLFGPTPDKFVSRHIESIKNGPIVISGASKNDTAWILFIKPVK